ncbi:protein-glucosylgalactosylhydroxylysine glucosidase-like [Amphiura filiformis]|uniref:protein-glucosylgalactosylhydroxylysine glucosidase-like n=1 Tax=Amphiura filiformis TaxID=82378 RepID=UPI003B2170CA
MTLTAYISDRDDASDRIAKNFPYKPGHKPDVLAGGCLCNKKYKDVSSRPDVFESPEYTDVCCQPTVGNGYIATVVYSDSIFMNGVYNGKDRTSHRARIPSTANIAMTHMDVTVSGNTYRLDTSQGLFTRIIDADTCTITQTVYAHQILTRLLINKITIKRKTVLSEEGAANNITVTLVNAMGPKSGDINFSDGSMGLSGEKVMKGNTTEAETDTSGTIPVYIHWTNLPDTITLPDSKTSQTWTFITSISHTDQEASDMYEMGMKHARDGTLTSMHTAAWKDKWSKGHIDVDNNLPLAKAIYGSMYYIMSSLPPLNYTENYPFQFYGLSPGGLAHGAGNADYMGHVFWDQATWMYPPILMFHPELAKAMLSCRTVHLDAAKTIAKQAGLKGAKFPWEMAYSGFDVCPAAIYTEKEIHVNGDIAFATQQYISATWDKDFLAKERGWEMVTGLADFWASRSEYDESKKAYVIKGVMPPDEYHQNVDNSVYTNNIAKISLNLPTYAAQFINATVPKNWTNIADHMFILFDEKNQYHPEYEGYTLGTFIKQADVILLGFPLMVDMPEQVRKNDLMFYESYNGKDVTDPNGPAMTWGMFAVGWMDLGNMTKANELFEKSFLNIQQPFKVWTETSSGSGAINFATGMGGFLQSVLFGYGGFRLRQDRLDLNFNLPPKSEHFNITGLNYLGSSIDFKADSTNVAITVMSQESEAPSLDLLSNGVTKALVIGKTASIPLKSAASIKPHTAFQYKG